MSFEENLSKEITANIMGVNTIIGGGFSSSKVPYHLTILSIVEFDQKFKDLMLYKAGDKFDDCRLHNMMINLLDYSVNRLQKEINRYKRYNTNPFSEKLDLLEYKRITKYSVYRVIDKKLDDTGDTEWGKKFGVSVVKYKDKYKPSFEFVTYSFREELHELVKKCNERKEQEMRINSRRRVV